MQVNRFPLTRWLVRSYPAWMLAVGALGTAGQVALAQTSPTATTASPATLPSVPDEAAGATPAALTGNQDFQKKLDRFNSLAQAREEIRRAFVRQQYQQVIALSQDVSREFNVQETSSFYSVAAQLRLSEKKDAEDGRRAYPRIGDRPPDLPNPLPSVESDQPAGTPAPAATATPEATATPAITEVAPGAGQLVAANPTPGGENAAVATPEATPTPEATAEAAAGSEREVATAMTPAPTPVAPVGQAAPAAASNPMERILIGVVVAALLVLVLLFVMMKRRRQEPDEDLETTLGGLAVEPEPDGEPTYAPRTAHAPEPVAAPRAPQLSPVDEDLFGEETMEAPRAPKPEAAPPAPAPHAAPPAATAPAAPPELPDDIFDDTFFEKADETQGSDATAGAASGGALAEEANPFAELLDNDPDAKPFGNETIGAPVSLDDLPAAEQPEANWAADDSIRIEGFGEPEAESAETREARATAEALEMTDLPMADARPEPEGADTRVKDDEPAGDASEAGPMETTRTAWDRDAEETISLSAEEIDEARQSGEPTVDEDRIHTFRPDETINLVVSEIEDGEATVAGSDTLAPSPGEDDRDTIRLEDAGGDEEGGPEDLFDREKREGSEAYLRNDWAGAVHHLSVAAALRPDHMEVKEMLREARRRRKLQDGG